jgi:hypothetical protein
MEVIERVRVGSHQEFVPTDDKGHGYHQIVEEYTTHYDDCLVSKEWLQEHEHSLDGWEPTIEITLDDKTLSVNGNYRKGMIKDWVKTKIKGIGA